MIKRLEGEAPSSPSPEVAITPPPLRQGGLRGRISDADAAHSELSAAAYAAAGADQVVEADGKAEATVQIMSATAERMAGPEEAAVAEQAEMSVAAVAPTPSQLLETDECDDGVAHSDESSAAHWQSLNDEVKLGGWKAADKEERKRVRRVELARQRERMLEYMLMAGNEKPPPASERRARVSWAPGVSGRVQQLRSRAMPVSVAPAEASAWCAMRAAQTTDEAKAIEADKHHRPSSPVSVMDAPKVRPSDVQTPPSASPPPPWFSQLPPRLPSSSQPPSKLVAAQLRVGTPDPHGLELNDDKVRQSRRRPTFSVNAHRPASQAELEVRPVAALNVPEATEPLPPPELPPADAPIITSLDQLLKLDWLKRVRMWERRCRRCIRLAKRGDWRAARRIRPADLWVSAEESMLPGVAAWSWDLRPLSRGEPAVPIAPSGVGGVEPQGDICLNAVRALLDAGTFADKAILSDVLNGVSDDVRAPRGSLLCAPHTGALQGMAQAEAKLKALVDEDWAETHESLPFWPLRCDPYSVVDESERVGAAKGSFAKARLTNDHSWPPPGAIAGDGTVIGHWGEHVPSLNESMDRDQWPAARMVLVREVAEAAATLKTSGVAVKISVLDCRAYYKRFGRQLAELWRNGAVTADGYIIDGRCCFGSAADAAKCTRFSNVMVHAMREELRAVDAAHPSRDPRVLRWLKQRRAAGEAAGATEAEIAERWACLHVVSMYIDDESTVSTDDALYDLEGAPVMKDGKHVSRAEMHFEVVKRVLERFGHESEPRKEQSPRVKADLLGVEIDVEAGTMKLAAPKRAAYAKLAGEAARQRVIERAVYESLLGKLTFAATCYPRGRQWLHAPWRAARAAFRTAGGGVVVSKSVRASLEQWACELTRADHPGVPLACTWDFPPPTDQERAVAIYADAARACASAGFGAWAVKGEELIYVCGEWSSDEQQLLICDLELAASTFGLVALQPIVGRRAVYSYTDNTVAMSAMRSLSPTTAAMQHLTAARTSWILAEGVAEAAERITSASNLWADMLSRGDEQGVVEQAAALGLRARRVDVPAGWRELLQLRQPEAEDGDVREGNGATPSPVSTRPVALAHALPTGVTLQALRTAASSSADERASVRKRFLDAATVDGSGGLRTSGVRWWLKYCVMAREVLPFTRLDASSPLAQKVEAEALLMDFCIWLATARPSGRPISANTIKKYVSQVRAWHRRQFRTELCGNLDYSAINDLMRGVCRLVQQPPRKVRHGVRTQELAEALKRFLSPSVVAMSDRAEAANWTAALTVAFCGLLRAAEFALQPGETMSSTRCLTRGDISFRRDENGEEYVVLTMRPAKGEPGAAKEVPLLLGGGGTFLDPVKALRRLLEEDPVPEELKASTPLFRNRHGKAFTVPDVRRMVKLLMGGIGLDPARFGAHSLRIGGATAGLAAGLSPAALRAAGRWSSDVYLIYTRASKQAVRGISQVIGSTAFEDLERGEFLDDELTITTADIVHGGIKNGDIEQELIDDALADEEDM